MKKKGETFVLSGESKAQIKATVAATKNAPASPSKEDANAPPPPPPADGPPPPPVYTKVKFST
jgi:hypothetical protein